eukprot:scaffold17436_cov112-Isochrysis_galbana.AAC.3
MPKPALAVPPLREQGVQRRRRHGRPPPRVRRPHRRQAVALRFAVGRRWRSLASGRRRTPRSSRQVVRPTRPAAKRGRARRAAACARSGQTRLAHPRQALPPLRLRHSGHRPIQGQRLPVPDAARHRRDGEPPRPQPASGTASLNQPPSRPKRHSSPFRATAAAGTGRRAGSSSAPSRPAMDWLG